MEGTGRLIGSISGRAYPTGVVAAKAVAEKPAEKPQEPAVEAPTPAVEAPAPEDKPKMDMVAARKILADLNKEAGSNVARETLKKLGYANLKAVPEDKLQEVVDAAREEAGDA